MEFGFALSRKHGSGVASALPAAPSIDQSSLPDATIDAAYSEQLTATGGLTPITWAVTTGALPDGLELSATGLLSGTPTTVESASFIVTAYDGIGRTDTQSLTVDVVDSDWLSQLLDTGRTGAWLTDQAGYFSLTGSDVDTWKEASGNTNLDLAYVAPDSKSIYDATHPVNTAIPTVRTGGFLLSRYAAGAAGKTSMIWPGGKGSLFFAVKIIGAVSDGAWNSNDGIFRHGDTSSWGGLVQIAGRAGGVSGYRVRATCYDGATKTVDHNVADEIPAGWHVIAIRNDGSNLSLKVDNYTENQTPCGAMSYVDGVLRALSPYSTGQDVAIAAMVAYSWYDTTNRDTVIGQLQSLITDLP